MCDARIFALIGLLLFAPPALATDWPMSRIGPGHPGVTADDGPSAFNLLWKVANEDDVNGEPTVVGDRVYAVNEAGVLRCVRTSDGSTLWSRHGVGGSNRAAPAVVSGRLHIGKGPNNDGFLCLDVADGTLLWEKDEGFGKVPGSPTVADGKVYYATNSGYVVCRDAETGELLWYYEAGEQCWSSPAIDVTDRRVVVTTLGHRVLCLPMDNPHPETKKLADSDRHWAFSVDDDITGSAALYDVDDADQILVGTASGRLYWLHDDGTHAFEQRSAYVGGRINGTPCVNLSRVWVGSDNEKVRCFDRSDGSEVWNVDTGGYVHCSPAVADEHIYFTVGSGAFALYAVDAYSTGPAGTEVWKDQTYNYQYSSPVVVGGILYVGEIGSEDAYLLAIGPQSGGSASTSACYPIGPGTLRVEFDRAITTASGTTASNYTLTSAVPVITAVMDGDRAVVLTLLTALSEEAADVLTVSNIVAEGGDPMLAPQSLDLWGGIHTAAQLQAPDPAFLGGAPCSDRSRFAGAGTALGHPAALRAVCTARIGNWYALQDVAGGPRSGIMVAAPSVALQPGHQYVLAGRVHESAGETAMREVRFVADEGVVPQIPDPVSLPIGTLADPRCDPEQALDTGEDWEGMMVHGANALLSGTAGPGRNFTVVASPGAPDTLVVDLETGALEFDPASVVFPVSVTGVLRATDGRFQVAVAETDAITLGVGEPPLAGFGTGLSLTIRPNPGSTLRVAFVLPSTGQVDLGVFDVTGRRVRTLAHGRFEDGAHERSWDGTDDAGRPTGAGLYFIRVAAGGEVLTVRGARIP